MPITCHFCDCDRPERLYLAGLQNVHVFLQYSVTVLLNEAFDLVLDAVGEVTNDERRRGHARLLKVHVSPVLAVQLLTPVLI